MSGALIISSRSVLKPSPPESTATSQRLVSIELFVSAARSLRFFGAPSAAPPSTPHTSNTTARACAVVCGGACAVVRVRWCVCGSVCRVTSKGKRERTGGAGHPDHGVVVQGALDLRDVLLRAVVPQGGAQNSHLVPCELFSPISITQHTTRHDTTRHDTKYPIYHCTP